MNDHNLDDLIIDDVEPKNNKFKGLLTITALIAIMLIVGIIFSKIVLKDPNADKTPLEDNNSEMISPELTLQSTPETQSMPEPEEDTNESTISEEIEVKLNSETNSTEVEEVAKETIETTNETEEEAETSAPLPITSNINPTPTTEEAKKKPDTKKVVNKPVKPKYTASSTYYIQVGSFKKTPSKSFLSIIRNSGFRYIITAKASNGNKKLLIGPYRSKRSADKALPAVKELINKSAFVIKNKK
ncbi:MAG: SPOR domain-containing protein [Campylobacterota bacterium]|nr:SPOR domain-containing protein [Campylobacterota bacterium]